MRVLISTFTYPPNSDGVAEASSVLAKGLAARGHEVTVATAYHPGRGPDLPQTNPRVEQFKIEGEANFRVGIRGERQRYEQFLGSSQCDVMVFECWHTWGSHLALPLFKKIKARKVLISHGYSAHQWMPFPKFPWGLLRWLGGMRLALGTPLVMRGYDHIVFLSESTHWNRFLDHWIARATGYKRFSVIPNGAFVREFEDNGLDFRREFSIGPGPMLLCVANYCDRKNQKMALRAFRQAGLEGATLVFIGSEFNEYSREMEAMEEELKPKFPAGRVLLLEKVSRPMTCAAYRAADLFVLSAKAETQPIVLLEAMASRTPFISTDTGCVAELPGGVVARSEEEMILKMRELAASPEKREKLAGEAREACRTTYDWERVIDSYERLLLDLAGRPGAMKQSPAMA